MTVVESNGHDKHHQHMLSLKDKDIDIDFNNSSNSNSSNIRGNQDLQWLFIPSRHHIGYYQIQHVSTGLYVDIDIYNYNIIFLNQSSLISSSSNMKNTQLWQPIYQDNDKTYFK